MTTTTDPIPDPTRHPDDPNDSRFHDVYLDGVYQRTAITIKIDACMSGNDHTDITRQLRDLLATFAQRTSLQEPATFDMNIERRISTSYSSSSF